MIIPLAEELANEWSKVVGIATTRPRTVVTNACDIPPAMILGSPVPNKVICWKVTIIPVTVPNSPAKGAPLAGLLGTVTGMIVTFQQITLFGTGDPKIMAGGISQALVTTVLGLVVAIPTTLLHSFANSSARGIINVLEEQSTGIVAEHSENR